MPRYMNDESQVSFRYESGTYAEPSGLFHWVGMVQDHTIDESENIIPTRVVGTATRNVDQFIDGPRDVTGTINYFPQDWKFLAFALGSNVDGGSPQPYTHTMSEVNSDDGYAFTSGTLNPFGSFTIVDEKVQTSVAGENFVRTIKGAVVNSMTIRATQGEPVNVDLNYNAQVSAYSSGTKSSITADTSRPYLWSDTKLHLASGLVLQTTKDFSFTLNNNMESPHYVNGSRVASVPLPLNRDYELTATIDLTSEKSKELYDQYFQGGSTFNMILDINQFSAVGSKDVLISMSGCKMIDFENSTPMEGVSEATLTVQPTTVSALANDSIQLYNME